MVMIVGSLHQMREYFAVQVRSGDFPSPALLVDFSLLVDSFKDRSVLSELGSTFSVW